jgi:hypothetical protein
VGTLAWLGLDAIRTKVSQAELLGEPLTNHDVIFNRSMGEHKIVSVSLLLIPREFRIQVDFFDIVLL